MSRSALTIGILLTGLVGGWGSALYSMQSVGSDSAGIRGHWRSWNTGSDGDASPYALAHYMLEGEIPPAEGLFRSYTTTSDDAGQVLDPRCLYRVVAPTEKVRWWSFSAGRQPSADPALPVSVTSESVLRDATGSVSIAVGSMPQPGNWVSPAPGSSMQFNFLVAHDGKLGDDSNDMLPSITKQGCAT